MVRAHQLRAQASKLLITVTQVSALFEAFESLPKGYSVPRWVTMHDHGMVTFKMGEIRMMLVMRRRMIMLAVKTARTISSSSRRR